MRLIKNKQTVSVPKLSRNADSKLPFMEHVKELKRRLTYVAVSIITFGAAAYGVQQHIINFLLKPTNGQKLIYTSPGGGLNFLFQVCIYVGVVCSLPVIIYQILKYLEPLLGSQHVRFALKGSIVSAILAVAGMLFGYYVGMPATLHFLFHQFTSTQIHPLITIQNYMSFVTMYMFGAALLFQLPLIMICINRIKPLQPQKLFKYERWVIVGSFVLAVIMNPTPNVIDQLMLAGPMILMYQVGILIIALSGHSRHLPSRKFQKLLAGDAQLQSERESRLASAKLVWQQASAISEHPSDVSQIVQQQPIMDEPAIAAHLVQDTTMITAHQPSHVSSRPTVTSGRPNKYVDGFVRLQQRPSLQPVVNRTSS